MEKIYKTNWTETKEYFEEWWRGKNRRPLLVCEPRVFFMCSGSRDELFAYENWKEKWAKTPGIFERLKKEYKENHFEGEGFPFYSPYLGPGSLAAHLGAKVKFGQNTIWFEAASEELSEISGEFTDPEGWWDWTLESIKEAKNGKIPGVHVSIPDLEIGLDIISALVGPNSLLLALIEEPEEVHRLQKSILETWKKRIDELYEATREEDGFSSYSHFYIMGKGKTSTLQCDFGTMISPDMFQEFMVPYLKEYAKHTDRNIYHLDGVDNLRHLDAILEIPEIQCIQWTPGAGKPGGSDPCWDEIYKKTLEHGKNIYVLAEARQIKDFVKRFGKQGVYLRSEINDPKEARELIRELEK